MLAFLRRSSATRRLGSRRGWGLVAATAGVQAGQFDLVRAALPSVLPAVDLAKLSPIPTSISLCQPAPRNRHANNMICAGNVPRWIDWMGCRCAWAISQQCYAHLWVGTYYYLLVWWSLINLAWQVLLIM